MFEEIKKQHRTTITIDSDDFDYITTHQLKPSHLVRAMVRDHRVHTEDPLAHPTTREMQERSKRVSARLNQLLKVMQEILSKKQFEKLMEKLK